MRSGLVELNCSAKKPKSRCPMIITFPFSRVRQCNDGLFSFVHDMGDDSINTGGVLFLPIVFNALLASFSGPSIQQVPIALIVH